MGTRATAGVLAIQPCLPEVPEGETGMSLLPHRSRTARRRALGVTLSVSVLLTAGAVGLSPPTYVSTPRTKKPGAPRSVSVQPTDQGAIVSWSPPASAGTSPITGYSVKVGEGRWTETCTTTTATTCTVTGLMDGRTYRARVRAVSLVGEGTASESAAFVPGQSPDCDNLVPGADLAYCSFTSGKVSLAGLDLAGADFWGAKLVGVDFTGSDLAGALFGGDTEAQADLTSVDFSGADLTGATLDDTYLYSVAFDGADVADASFTGATLIFNDFTGADLTGASLDQADLLQFPVWSNTICPDGTNSDDDGGTCANDLG